MEHTPSRATPSGGSAGGPANAAAGTSSFTDLLRARAPHLLPGGLGGTDPDESVRARRAPRPGREPATGGTTVALTFDGGVLIAGDRRASSGGVVVRRDVETVAVTDAYSAVGIAGTTGLGVELLRRFTMELAQYEKIEGVPLSLDGKTNKLAALVRDNLDLASTGLAVLALFVGVDTAAADPSHAGRIVSYDVVGGRYEEHAGFHGVGSGALSARSALRKLHDPGGDARTALRHAVAALYDAADDDPATGGPDPARGIHPSIVTITAAEGAVRVPDEETAAVAEAVVTDRASRHRG